MRNVLVMLLLLFPVGMRRVLAFLEVLVVVFVLMVMLLMVYVVLTRP